MSFDELMNDLISVLKQDGNKYENVKASVQSGRIFLNAGKMLVELGDIVHRKMSNGGEEFFEILDPGFYEGMAGAIPATYQMKVKRLSKSEAMQIIQSVPGEQPPVNQNVIPVISEAGRQARFKQWEILGVDRVKADLEHTGGERDIGGPPEVRELAWEWVRMKMTEKAKSSREISANDVTHIADSRLIELRNLPSAEFDFTKLIRLCEEINIAYAQGCYFATAMLTRALLDHVPPLFGKATFTEVANNYAGGGKSFRETMLHLENAARKIGDAHLHVHIRKSETLPVAQQVNRAAELDMLLSEIVRINQKL